MVRKFIVTFLIVVFIIVSLIIAIAFGIYQSFFGKEFYKSEIVNSLYDYLIKEGQTYIEFEPVREINNQDFYSILEKNLSKDDLKIAISDVFYQIEKLKVKDNGIIEIKMPLRWLSKNSENFSYDLSNYLFNNLKACEIEKNVFIKSFNCIPKNLSKEDFDASFKLALDREFLSEIPDDFILKFKLPENFKNQYLKDIILNLLKDLFLASLLIMIVIMLLIALIIYKPAIRILKWESKAVFLSASFLMLFVMLMNILMPKIINGYFFTANDQPQFSKIYVSLYILITGILTKNLLVIIVPALIFGLGFWIIGIIFDKKNWNNYGNN